MVIQSAPVCLRDFKNELLDLLLKVQSKKYTISYIYWQQIIYVEIIYSNFKLYGLLCF